MGNFVDKVDIHDRARPGSMRTDIRDTIDYTRAYAEEMRDLLSESIGTIGDIPSYVSGNIPTDFQHAPWPTASWPTKPVMNPVGDIVDPAFPAVPTLQDTQVNPVAFPPSPNITYSPEDIPITPPQVNIPDITGNVPEMNIPDAPLTPIQLSTYPDISIPTPSLQMPDIDFSFTAPAPPVSAGVDGLDFNAEQYLSWLWDVYYPKVITGVQEGGTGLTDAVYQAILQREQESRFNLQDKARQVLAASFSSSGFDAPTGAMTAALLEFEQDIVAKDLAAVHGIMIKEFDVADANAKFVKELGLKVETLLRQTFEQSENRRLSVAQAAVDISLKIFDASVKKYLAEWEAIKVQFQAKKSQIDAVISYNDGMIKAYLGELEGAIKQVEALVKQDTIKIDKIKADVDVYSTRVEAETKKQLALLEEVKIEAEQVKLHLQKYVAEIDLVKVETSSKVEIEKIKANAAELEARIYQTTVSAISEENKSIVDIEKMKLEQNRSDVDIYKSQIDAESSKVDASAKQVQAQLSTNDMRLKEYSESIRAAGTQLQASLEQIKTQVQIFQTQVGTQVDVERINLEAFTSVNSVRTGVQTSIAQIASQAIASALGAINTNMGYSYSGSESHNSSASLSNNLSESHMYEQQ